MKAADIACLVLASGLSERFGASDKLAEPLCGKPVLDYVLETVMSLGFGENYLVSKGRAQAGFTSVMNKTPENGQGHALRLGLSAVKAAGWERICVVLGDMPLVEATHLRNLIEKSAKAQSVVSAFEGQKSPPAIFRKTAITSILADKSTSGARAIFDQLNPVCVPITAQQALDVDTPADLARVMQIMESRNT